MVIHTWLLLEIIYLYDTFGNCNNHDGSPNVQSTTVFFVNVKAKKFMFNVFSQCEIEFWGYFFGYFMEIFGFSGKMVFFPMRISSRK
jgi:hypothetical protein